MKKIVSILMSSALLLGLVGCNNANNNQQGTTNPTNQNTEVVTTETTTQTETQETEIQYQVYSLDGMSSEEIYNLIISFSTGINTGDTLDNYPDRFSVEPYNRQGSSGQYNYVFWGSDYNVYYQDNKPNNLTNYIDKVRVYVQEEMDGTITVKEYSQVSVDFVLNDYDTASDVYDRLYNHLVQALANNEYGEALYDNRNGTSWTSGSENLGFYVTMNQTENGGFFISVVLPISV